MGELAVGPVDLAPLIEQREDLRSLLGQDAVHRTPARGPVDQRPESPAGHPAVGADLAELEHPASPSQRPAPLDRGVEQVQQAGLGGRVDPVRDSATQPQPSFPSTSVSLTANSLQASDSRAISAFAASSS